MSDAARWGFELSEVAIAPQDGVWPENWPALIAFLTVCTQFRALPFREGFIALGLDYTGARAGLDMAGIEVTPALWADVQQIEAAAVAALNGTDEAPFQ